MNHYQFVIRRQAHVELKGTNANAVGILKAWQGIFRRFAFGAAVSV
jgi:hypothetical protein